jgi:hypothetical protein
MDGHDETQNIAIGNGEQEELGAFLSSVFSSSEITPQGCDTAAYLAELDTLDISDADKVELIHTLWRLIESLVRIQFGFDPVQEARDQRNIQSHKSGAPMVGLKGNANANFNSTLMPNRESP